MHLVLGLKVRPQARVNEEVNGTVNRGNRAPFTAHVVASSMKEHRIGNPMLSISHSATREGPEIRLLRGQRGNGRLVPLRPGGVHCGRSGGLWKPSDQVLTSCVGREQIAPYISNSAPKEENVSQKPQNTSDWGDLVAVKYWDRFSPYIPNQRQKRKMCRGNLKIFSIRRIYWH